MIVVAVVEEFVVIQKVVGPSNCNSYNTLILLGYKPHQVQISLLVLLLVYISFALSPTFVSPNSFSPSPSAYVSPFQSYLPIVF